MVAFAARLMATVVVATDVGIDFTARQGSGPGARSFQMLISYAAWAGYRLAAVGFLVSVGVAAFGRMQAHPGAEQFGKRGALTALGVALAIAAADALFEFAAAVGNAA
jgi:hypothetical protein